MSGQTRVDCVPGCPTLQDQGLRTQGAPQPGDAYKVSCPLKSPAGKPLNPGQSLPGSVPRDWLCGVLTGGAPVHWLDADCSLGVGVLEVSGFSCMI